MNEGCDAARDRDLTILLTLKDRVPYTARWMQYADRVRMPFRVLVADGGGGEGAQALLSDKTRFPNVEYEYVRFPVDHGYADYYSKMAGAMALVKTPFVAMADNDDFFVVDGLRDSVRFLAGNPGYASCGGQGAIFWTAASDANDAVPRSALQWKCTRETEAVEADTARERLRIVSISKSDTFYYDVKRTAQARTQFEAVRDLGLKDLFLVEHLVWHLAAVAGKTRRLDRLYLARQQDSPGSSGATHQQVHGDWVGRMLVETWSEDFMKFLHAVSTRLAEVDGITIEEARDCVIRSYRASVAPSLLSDLQAEPTVNMAMNCIVPVVRRLAGLPEASMLRRLARFVYRRVGSISLDVVYGTEVFARRVPDAHRDFKPIEEFLRGPR